MSDNDSPSRPPDLEELESESEVTVFQASGPGGQHRNRTYSAVRLKHIPTGIIVTAADTRSQLRNRKIAFERLAERLAEHYHVDPPRKPTGKSAAVRRREREQRQRESEKRRERRKPTESGDS